MPLCKFLRCPMKDLNTKAGVNKSGPFSSTLFTSEAIPDCYKCSVFHCTILEAVEQNCPVKLMCFPLTQDRHLQNVSVSLL